MSSSASVRISDIGGQVCERHSQPTLKRGCRSPDRPQRRRARGQRWRPLRHFRQSRCAGLRCSRVRSGLGHRGRARLDRRQGHKVGVESHDQSAGIRRAGDRLHPRDGVGVGLDTSQLLVTWLSSAVPGLRHVGDRGQCWSRFVSRLIGVENCAELLGHRPNSIKDGSA